MVDAHAVHASQQRSQPPTSRLLAAAMRDPVLDDLRDIGSPARSLALPKSEQAREQRLQELEDERLDRCRTSSPFAFDQCFFFGSMDTQGRRRALEGGGTLTPPREQAESRGDQRPPLATGRVIPTW